jgi:phosphonate transport system permease protein
VTAKLLALAAQRSHPALLWGLAWLGAIAGSLYQAGLFQAEIVNPGGWAQAWRFLSASWQPDLSPDLLSLTWNATLKTLAYAVCGTCLSVLLGLIGGVLASAVWWSAVFPERVKLRQAPSIWLSARAILAVPRAIHELIWGLLFVNLWGLDPLTAVLAIAVPFGAITAKVFADLLDDTPRQPLVVLLNSGMAPWNAFLYGLLPQALLNLVSYSFYRFECAIRSAAVLGIIGAGGLGYEIFLSLQSLQYGQLWTFFYALVLLNGSVDFASAWLRQQLGCARRLDLNTKSPTRTPQTQPARSPNPNSNLKIQTSKLLLRSRYANKPQNSNLSAATNGLMTAIALGLISFCFWFVGADFSKLWSALTWQRLGKLLQACFPPDWQVAAQLGDLAVQTVAMSVLAIAIAAAGGTLLAFPAAHNFWLPGGWLNPNRRDRVNRIAAWLLLLGARVSLLVCRAIPAPIWALVLLFVLFPGLLPGAIALGLHNLGILGRLQAEVIENLDERPIVALKAQGSPNALIFLYGILPLTAPRFLAYDLYRWEVCMRETVIVGLVGAGGLGRVLTEQLSSFDYGGMVITLSGFVLLTFCVDWLSAVMRRSVR